MSAEISAPSPSEVCEVVFASSSLFFDAGQAARPGRLMAFGETAAGRLLAVYLDTPVGAAAIR